MNSLSNAETTEVRRIATTVTTTLIAPCYCSISRPTVQNIPDSEDTVVNFSAVATVEADTDDFFDTENPDQITIPKDGFYIATANVAFEADADGIRTLWVVNDSTVVARIRATSFAAEHHLSCTGGFVADANDVLEVKVRQSGGAGLDLNTARLTVVRIGGE